ncbi:MAG: TrbI/VirB10 family protein [Bacteriovoracaceae bacterium]
MILFSTIFLSFSLFAWSLKKEVSTTEVKPLKKMQKYETKNGRENVVYKHLMETNQRLEKLLLAKTSKPVIWNGGKTITATTTIKGLLLNSVVSTNLESPMVIGSIVNEGLPEGTRFSCYGVTKNKCVLTLCDRMISNQKEIPVSVQILNSDGAACLRGVYDDGKDALIAGAIASDFAKGVFSASQNRLSTPLGDATRVNERNQILGGMMGSANTTTDILLQEMKNQEPKVYIEAGKPVLIYFMEGLKEENL